MKTPVPNLIIKLKSDGGVNEVGPELIIIFQTYSKKPIKKFKQVKSGKVTINCWHKDDVQDVYATL